ncbi:MAG: hypothetical protein EBR82_00120 [Caulobacteraceae bacterium]|nr:hypothetical protein [Caulobacteraceae bacterium]
MAITKTSYDSKTGTTVEETYFAGRVIEVRHFTETRNWSSTLDYSDYRSTECTEALVWLGTHNFPPYRNTTKSDLRVNTGCLSSDAHGTRRDLEFFEQFAWVDCTNLFSDRNGFALSAAVDVSQTDGSEPLLWANYIAFQAYMAAKAEAAAKAAAEEARIAREEAAARAARKAKLAANRAAKEVPLRAAAEARLRQAPAKGTTVTVDGFTGRVFWAGVNKFRGNFKASYGVKDARGTVRWVEIPA